MTLIKRAVGRHKEYKMPEDVPILNHFAAGRVQVSHVTVVDNKKQCKRQITKKKKLYLVRKKISERFKRRSSIERCCTSR